MCAIPTPLQKWISSFVVSHLVPVWYSANCGGCWWRWRTQCNIRFSSRAALVTAALACHYFPWGNNFHLEMLCTPTSIIIHAVLTRISCLFSLLIRRCILLCIHACLHVSPSAYKWVGVQWRVRVLRLGLGERVQSVKPDAQIVDYSQMWHEGCRGRVDTL